MEGHAAKWSLDTPVSYDESPGLPGACQRVSVGFICGSWVWLEVAQKWDASASMFLPQKAVTCQNLFVDREH